MSQLIKAQKNVRTEGDNEVHKLLLLHPYFIVRVAGMPFSILESYRASQTVNTLNEMDSIRNRTMLTKDNICEQLEKYVGKLTNDKIRRQLINYKRNIYNNRSPKVGIDSFEEVLPTHLFDLIKQWERAQDKQQQLLDAAAEQYNNEYDYIRRLLQQHMNHPNFLNGIAFSSKDMLAKVIKYIDTPLEQHNKKLRKSEASMTQFVSRVAAKTSPLSTFTPISIGQWTDKSNQCSISHIDSHGPRTDVEINHAIIERIMQSFINHKQTRPYLSFGINPSLSILNSKIHYIKKTDDSKLRPKVVNTIEQPVTLDYNAPLQIVVQLFQGEKTQSFQQLIAAIAERIQQPEESIESFIHQLIDLQIVVPIVNQYEQTDDKLDDAQALLARIPTDSSRILEEQFSRVKRALVAYERQEAEGRLECLKEIDEAILTCIEWLEASISTEALKTPIYEDSYLSTSTITLSKDQFKPILSDLRLLQQLTPIFDSNFRLQSMIAKHFVDQYGEDGTCERPLDFISELIPIMKQWGDSLLPTVSAQEIHGDSEDIIQLNRLKGTFLNDLMLKMSEAHEEVRLCKDELQAIIDQIPQAVRKRTVSQSFFGQWGIDHEGSSFYVINQIYHGYSMFFSRFLKQYSPELTADMKNYVRTLFADDETPVEYLGTFGFNANLHPPLTDYELDIASLPDGHSTTSKVQFEDLTVKYDREKHRVYLHHQELGKLNVLYLGFLMPFSLPLIVRALSQMFNSGNISTLFILHKERRLTKEEGDQIRVYPRVRLGKVVISRKKWIVPNHLLPVRQKGEDDVTYFHRLLEWHRSNNIPDQVFYRLIPMDEQSVQSDDSDPSASDIDFTQFKPQYMNFESPLFVKMIDKQLRQTDYGLVIEEMSPTPSELPIQNEREKYVSELLIELSQTSH